MSDLLIMKLQYRLVTTANSGKSPNTILTQGETSAKMASILYTSSEAKKSIFKNKNYLSVKKDKKFEALITLINFDTI